MNLTITEKAAEKLPQKYTSFILTLNDGSNQFSNAEGCCMIGERFLIVPITETIDPFTLPVPAEHFHFYTSSYDTMFLKGQLVLDVNSASQTLMLKNEAGYLDTNVTIKQP